LQRKFVALLNSNELTRAANAGEKIDMPVPDPDTTPKRKLRSFQFSLRTLAIFVTLFAVACSWLAVKIQQTDKRENAINELCKLGYIVTWDYEDAHRLAGGSELQPPGPEWLRNHLGQHFFAAVAFVGEPDEDDVRLSDDISYLKDIIDTKSIRFCRVNEAKLKCLSGFAGLRCLNLSSSAMTDSDLQYVKRLKHLEVLSIDRTSITDAGLTQIGELKELKELYCDDTKVTEFGLENLKKTLPNVKIAHCEVY
jgi:hypothetical protein